MDRWGYYSKWADEERGRARLVPAWIDACILAAIVVSVIGGRLLHCAIEQGPLGSCIQAGMPRVLGISLIAPAFCLEYGPALGLDIGCTTRNWAGCAGP